jgi:hypothetical protein
MTSALYEPFIERDLDAIPAAARAFADAHSGEELWIAVTRFAVLAYAPSQHAKRAVLACRAAHDVREELGERWIEMIIECARYAAESRQPWSEPPILDPPKVDHGPHDIDELRRALAAGDRLRAERWLSARLDDAVEDLRVLAKGDAVLMLDCAIALQALLGEKGRFALLRMVIGELLSPTDDVTESLETLIDRAIEEKGSIESVRNVLVRSAAVPRRRLGGAGGSETLPASAGEDAGVPLFPYPLARDYAQTLLAHAIARTLPARQREFLAAVHHNQEHGESFAEWSFA